MKSRSAYSANAEVVLAVLSRQHQPLSAYQILASLEGTTIRSPVQVYRALSILMAGGLVHRVESLNAFVTCNCVHEKSRPGFLICRRCGAVSEFDDPRIGALEKSMKRTGFEVETLTLELSGLCPDCKRQAGAAA